MEIKDSADYYFTEECAPEIWYINEGKIIKEEESHKIFDMFYRTDESRNNQTGGSFRYWTFNC